MFPDYLKEFINSHFKYKVTINYECVDAWQHPNTYYSHEPKDKTDIKLWTNNPNSVTILNELIDYDLSSKLINQFNNEKYSIAHVNKFIIIKTNVDLYDIIVFTYPQEYIYLTSDNKYTNSNKNVSYITYDELILNLKAKWSDIHTGKIVYILYIIVRDDDVEYFEPVDKLGINCLVKSACKI